MWNIFIWNYFGTILIMWDIFIWNYFEDILMMWNIFIWNYFDYVKYFSFGTILAIFWWCEILSCGTILIMWDIFIWNYFEDSLIMWNTFIWNYLGFFLIMRNIFIQNYVGDILIMWSIWNYFGDSLIMRNIFIWKYFDYVKYFLLELFCLILTIYDYFEIFSLWTFLPIFWLILTVLFPFSPPGTIRDILDHPLLLPVPHEGATGTPPFTSCDNARCFAWNRCFLLTFLLLLEECWLTLTLLAVNLVNTKWCKNPEKWLKPWQMGTYLRVLSDSFPMNTNMTGLRWFSKFFASMCLGQKLGWPS